jgi:glycosyltransferase involved in cell wall biosynthesis
MKIVTIRHRFAHMGSHSGYDNLFLHLEKMYENDFTTIWRKDASFIQRAFGKGLRPVFNGMKLGPFYTVPSMLAEWRGWKLLKKSGGGIIHIAYLEDSFGLLAYLKKNASKYRHIKIVGTSHQPVSWWEKHPERMKLLHALDAMIVLSTREQAYFEKQIPGKVHFVRHGIDVDFFTPGEGYKQNKTCIFSGNWFRDIPCLIDVVKRVTDKDDTIRFEIVNHFVNDPNHPISELRTFKNATLHRNISDESLLELYRSADLLLLPLIESTANNAMLEATSCGLPIVTTDVGGVRDYTNGDFCNYAEKGDAAQLADYVLQTVGAPLQLKERHLNARRYAEQYLNWQVLAREVAGIYQSLFA